MKLSRPLFYFFALSAKQEAAYNNMSDKLRIQVQFWGGWGASPTNSRLTTDLQSCVSNSNKMPLLFLLAQLTNKSLLSRIIKQATNVNIVVSRTISRNNLSPTKSPWLASRTPELRVILRLLSKTQVRCCTARRTGKGKPSRPRNETLLPSRLKIC